MYLGPEIRRCRSWDLLVRGQAEDVARAAEALGALPVVLGRTGVGGAELVAVQRRVCLALAVHLPDDLVGRERVGAVDLLDRVGTRLLDAVADLGLWGVG